MNAQFISENIKKLREENNITQAQLADVLNISFQAVSKWECGTTSPDINILPEIAEYFGISIDDLFKEKMLVYRNRASRLMAIYESDSDNSEAFEKADREYLRLLEEGNLDDVDLGSYAYLNDLRMMFYAKKAEMYYKKAIEQGSVKKSDEYYKNQRQYIYFLSKLGRTQESIDKHQTILEKDPDNVMNYSSLVSANKYAGQLIKAYEVAEKGLFKFPDNAILLVYAGDICKQLGKYEEAVVYWEKAFKVDPEMIDTQYSLADYLLEQGKNSEAKIILEKIVAWNNQRGFTIENRWVRNKINEI